MNGIKWYDVAYSEDALQDIYDKMNYIAYDLKDPISADHWMRRLMRVISDDLSAFPEKYPIYQQTEYCAEWKVRFFTDKNDVVFYRVDETSKEVYVIGICNRRRDIGAFIAGRI